MMRPSGNLPQVRSSVWPMEEEGIYYFFTHTASKHTLVLADSYT
jgi:hypothetical protein